jgi:hypothetical protein
MQTLNFPGERLLKQFNSLSSSSKLSLSIAIWQFPSANAL